MGDRGNIVVRDGKTNRDDVWLYSHWCGSELPQILAKTLARKERWSDGSYLARMIFCAMVAGDEVGEAGYGISTRLGDNQHPILVVDVEKQKVFMVAEAIIKDGRLPNKLHGDGIPFADFTETSFADDNEDDEEP